MTSAAFRPDLTQVQISAEYKHVKRCCSFTAVIQDVRTMHERKTCAAAIGHIACCLHSSRTVNSGSSLGSCSCRPPDSLGRAQAAWYPPNPRCKPLPKCDNKVACKGALRVYSPLQQLLVWAMLHKLAVLLGSASLCLFVVQCNAFHDQVGCGLPALSAVATRMPPLSRSHL